MNLPSKELQDAVQNDPFAKSTLELIRDFIYMLHRDWDVLSKDGKPIFKDEQPAVLWNALCLILGNTNKPQEGKVNVGGVMVNMSSVHLLEEALSERNSGQGETSG